jgi:DNA-binding XRE family transcriptional regulator
MRHRHLSGDDPGDPRQLGLAALDDILDRGDLSDWAPVAARVSSDPWGPLADAVLELVDAHPMAGTGTLWRRWVHERRCLHPRPTTITDLRRAAGLTQAELAERLAMSQSDLSKLERRGDVRLSTLVRLAGAFGARLHVVLEGPGPNERITLRHGHREPATGN